VKICFISVIRVLFLKTELLSGHSQNKFEKYPLFT